MKRGILNRVREWIAYSCVLCIPAALLIAGCGGGNQGLQRPPVPVSSDKVEKRTVPIYEDAIGSVTASQSVNIMPQASGKITEIHFAQSSDVKKGDRLFTIDPSPYKAALDDAQARLAKDQSDLVLKQETLQRWLALKSSNYVSPQDLDAMKSAVESAKAAVEGSKAAVEAARINLDYCYIRSPIDGVTGKYLVDAGNVVTSSNQQTPLVSVQNVDLLYVDFALPEKSLIELRRALDKNGSLEVEVTALMNENIKGTAQLKYVDNQIMLGSGTISNRAVLNNTSRLFWPGQSVRVKVILRQIPDALLVPFQALQVGQQGPFVFIIKADQTADMKMVEPGQRQGDKIVINKGLDEGSDVVTSGHLMLAPGARVIVMPPAGGMSPEQSKQMASGGN